MNSFGNDGANKGISVHEIKLNLLSPEGFNHNNINGSLAEMESSAYYLYYAQSGSLGKRYWFHTKPNINILINQARADIQQPDIDAEILNLIKGKTSNKIELFNVIVSPNNDIPEQLKPTLIVLAPSQYGSSTDIAKSTKDIISNFDVSSNKNQINSFSNLNLFGEEIKQRSMSLSSNNGINDYFLFNDLRNGNSTIHSWDIIETTERQKFICYLLLKNRRKSAYGKLDGNPLSYKHFVELDESIRVNELEELVKLNILKKVDYSYRIIDRKRIEGL
jgi:hypothetical protein